MEMKPKGKGVDHSIPPQVRAPPGCSYSILSSRNALPRLGNFHLKATINQLSESVSRSVMSSSLRSHGLQPIRLLCPWNSLGKSVCNFLLHRIFPTQGLNPSLTLKADSLPTEPPGKQNISLAHYKCFPLIDGLFCGTVPSRLRAQLLSHVQLFVTP